MSPDQNDHASDPPFYPSGYTPEVEEQDSGYTEELFTIERSHSGPIPSPEDLDYYKQVLPDAPDRLLRMAEQNAQSLRDLTKLRLDSQITIDKDRHREASTGQLFGLIAVGLMSVVAVVALITNHPVVAGTICSTTIIGVATVFVTGRKKQDKEENGNHQDNP